MAALQHGREGLARRIRPQGRHWYSITLHNWNNASARPAEGLHREQERVYFDGTTTPADPKFDPHNPRSAWAVIVQRAVRQAVHDWDPSQSLDKPHGGGAGDALAILTGGPFQEVHARSADVQKAVRAALEDRRPVVFGKGGHYWAVLGMSRKGVLL
jgi:hypothetical protein